jgi:hypothetical protein
MAEQQKGGAAGRAGEAPIPCQGLNRANAPLS